MDIIGITCSIFMTRYFEYSMYDNTYPKEQDKMNLCLEDMIEVIFSFHLFTWWINVNALLGYKGIQRLSELFQRR